MIICGICILITLIYGLFIKGTPPGWEKKQLVRLMIILEIAGLLVSGAELWQEKSEDGAIVERNDAGKGRVVANRKVSFVDDAKTYQIEIDIPERKLTDEEAREVLVQAKREIDESFLGRNESINNIETDVNISNEYADGVVEASWSFSDYEHIDTYGHIDNENLETAQIVEASVQLSYGDSQEIYTFYFSIVPKDLSEVERRLLAINKDIASLLDSESTSKKIVLPSKVEDKELKWGIKPQRIGLKLMILGLLSLLAIGYGRVIDNRKKLEKRKENLKMQYAQIVSTIALLLGAGMSIRKIWERMTISYKEVVGGYSEAYEEMLISLHQMQSGVPEFVAVEQFGTRCQVQSYRKLSGILLQYMQKGSRDVGRYLSDEVREAFEERKALAKIQGEKASTRLLLPMIMLLMIVLVIILIPAMLSFSL